MMLRCLAETVVSILFNHLLDYVVALKGELLCLIANFVIFFFEIVKLLDAALETS